MVYDEEEKLLIVTILGMYHITLADGAVEENWCLFPSCVICEHKNLGRLLIFTGEKIRPASL